MVEQRFEKTKRLLSSAEFNRVFDSPHRRVGNRHLLILAKRNNLAHGRIGFVIAKKNVRLASERNRIKRVFREFFRLNPNLFAAFDLVVLVKRGLDQRSNAEIRQLISRLCVELQKPK